MAKWLNHIAVAAPRMGAGVFTHTLNPASDTAIAGTNFTPTAGRFLFVVIHGAVTSYGISAGPPVVPPSGWTMPSNGDAVSSTGLYMWHRTAVGGDTLTVTHNGANYPVGFHFFEFAAGSTFIGIGARITDISDTTANSAISGLTGTNCVMAAKGHPLPNAAALTTCSWNAPNIEVSDFGAVHAGINDGYTLSICYQEDYTGSSYQPTGTTGRISNQALTWAINVAAGAANYNETGRSISISASVVGVGDAFTTTNPIPAENALTGYAPANWQISGVGDTGALGYTTTMSVAAGSSIDFKIHTGGSGYNLEIVRLGWYNNNGARLVHTFSGRPGVTQPASVQGGTGTGEGGTGSHSCTSWTVTDTWTVPSDACHGLYLGVIKRSGGSASHVGPFVVTTAHSAVAEIMCKLSDFTWHAYNSMGTLADPTGGKSLYGVGAGLFAEGNRAWSQSYDAPLTYAGGAPQTSYWNGEQPLHTWLERNGYDVAYTSCLDVDANPGLLLGHKVIISEGHDEYWSQNLRDAWDAAIAAGVNAIVASGNTMLWRVRMVGRTMWCYKDTHSLNGTGSGQDPGTEWTGCWRDTRWTSRRPENESVGTMFVKNGLTSVAITVPDTYKTEPLWRGTSVASLGTGTSETLKTHSLGFEWDSYEPFYTDSMAYPPGLKLLSLTVTDQTTNACHPNGAPYATTINPANHYIVAFKRGTSLVVNLGVNQWGYGLSDFHTSHSGGGGTLGENTTMKQATVNLLADMGCQPGTIQSGLSAATLTAWTFPTLSSGLSIQTALSIAEGDTSAQLTSALVTWSNGTTSDIRPYATWTSTNEAIATVSSRGVVTGVGEGTATITATYGAASDTCAVTVTAATGYDHVWTGADPSTVADLGNYELGTWFTVSEDTELVGIRIYNPGLQSTGFNRLATLWTHNGSGGSTFVQRTIDIPDLMTAGWSEHLFATPYEATSAGFYCVSYWVDGGPSNDYSATSHGLDTALTTGPVTIPSGGGRFVASSPAQAQMPTELYAPAMNFYGVDVLYTVVAEETINYTELEWNLKVQAPAAASDIYEFRVYAGSTPLDAYAVTPQLTVGTAGVNYNETGRSITIVATVTQTEQLDTKELALAVQVVATTEATPQYDHRELALPVSIVATATAIPQYDNRELALAISVTATATATPQYDHRELALAVPAVATVERTDQADFKELALATPVVATVTTPTGLLKRNELALAVPVVASITAPTDQADFKQPATLTVVSAVADVTAPTQTFSHLGSFDETGRSITIVAAVTSTDQADFKEVVSASQAVRFDAGDEYYSRSASGLGGSSLTMACWVYLSVDTNFYAGFLAAWASASNYIAIETNGDGTTLDFYALFAGSAGGVTGPSVNMSVGQWYYTAFSFDTAGTGVMYYATAADSALTPVALGFSSYAGVTEPSTFYIGMDGWASDRLNGRIAQVKVWKAALTQAELEAEKPLDSVARTANLWGYYSFRNGPQTNDESGNGRTLTASGALSSEAGLFITGPQVFINAGVTATDALTAGGVGYDETNRPVSITATATATEQADFKETPVSVSVVADFTAPTQSFTHLGNFNETGRAISIVATVTETSQVDYKSNVGLAVSVVATVTVPTDRRKTFETALAVPGVATITTTTQVDFKTFPTLDVSINALVSCVDNQQSPGHYEDTGLLVNVGAVVAITEQADFKDLARSVSVTATVVHTALHKRFELVALSVTATVAYTTLYKRFEPLALPVTATAALSTDQADFKDLARSTSAVATVTLLEGIRAINETDRSIAIIATVTRTDQADFKDLVKALDVSSTVNLTDQADYHQTLAVLIVATITRTDLQRYANGVVLNQALALYLGNSPVVKVYAGPVQVWP